MNTSDATSKFPGTVSNVVTFRMTGIGVDVGDHLHVNGRPQGTAIVVWRKKGRVAVAGHLFADSPQPTKVRVTCQFTDSEGNKSGWRNETLTADGGWVDSKQFLIESPDDGKKYTKVVIRTRKADLGANVGISWASVDELTFSR